MAYVNLWELMTTIASKRNEELSNHDKCKAVQEKVGQVGGFGNELSLEIDEHGTWIVKIFSCYSEYYTGTVELKVSKSGHVSVTRQREDDGITDNRTVSF